MKDKLIYFLGKKKYVLLIFVFMGSMLGAYFFLPQEAVHQISEAFMASKEFMFNDQMQISVWLLLKNNLVAAAVAVFTGLIPFLYLPVISTLLNGFLIGAIMRVASSGMGAAVKLFLVGIVPHGIFELTALIFAMGIGITLCHNISKAILRKEHQPIGRLIQSAVYLYVTVIVPMLIAAAFIETYITPKLILWAGLL